MSAATALGEPTAPDFAEPLEAWRVWRVVAAECGYRLGSIVKSTVWPVGEPLVAECLRAPAVLDWFGWRRRGAHPVPSDRCDCGIYGTGLGPLVAEYVRDPPPRTPRAVARVLGEVSLWGTVVECERGYRASHAYPLRLYVPCDASPKPDRHPCDALAVGLAVYGVPVELVPAPCGDAVELLAAAR